MTRQQQRVRPGRTSVQDGGGRGYRDENWEWPFAPRVRRSAGKTSEQVDGRLIGRRWWRSPALSPPQLLRDVAEGGGISGFGHGDFAHRGGLLLCPIGGGWRGVGRDQS
ncbi:unnamed protein product [Lampetra fluviatilis]